MGAIGVLFAIAPAAHAEPWAAPRPDPRVFSASPDSASTSIGWRSQLHGRIGVVIPFVGETAGGAGEGFALRLPAFIELYNFTASAIPYQLWRGRLVLDGSFAWRTRTDDPNAPLWRVGLALEHESDHSSVSVPRGFVNLNSISVHGDGVVPLDARTVFYASAVARLHVLTCTRDPVLCDEKNGAGGSRAFEASVEADLSHALSTPTDDEDLWLLFAATYATFLLPSELAVAERRATLEAGVADATRSRGTFQLFATSLFGDDVGFFRGTRQMVEVGGGIRWTP